MVSFDYEMKISLEFSVDLICVCIVLQNRQKIWEVIHSSIFSLILFKLFLYIFEIWCLKYLL